MSTRSEAPSENSSLSESTYELIDTDEESRDDNATESVASADFSRSEDVASLANTSGEDSGDEHPETTSSIPTLLEQSANSVFDTPTIGRSGAVLHDDMVRSTSQSIEFEESFNIGAETISVKHTVADYNEEQSAGIAQEIQFRDPPKRLVATIRQTMTKQGLSTKNPLRILYVGSHSAKQDIIHKIASSVTASVDSDKRAQHLRHTSSQLYNVVPVSEFGSEKTPEIELMHSSGYQINVEDCTSAHALSFGFDLEKPNMIKLTFGDNFAYHSIPEGRGFVIQPDWELPHVAVFYCSDGDSVETRRTRALVRTFMRRHSVPSIVISHKQLFSRGRCMSLDQHAVHLCLESRDPNGRGNIIHQRLPIDLASFLTIDARQMNRNLAYLTESHQSLNQSSNSVGTRKEDNKFVNPHDSEKPQYSMGDSVNFLRNRMGAGWRALLPVGLLLVTALAALFTGMPNYRSATQSAISIHSIIMSAMPIPTTSTDPSALDSATSRAITPISMSTSTRTMTITRSSAPNSHSLALLPSIELGSYSYRSNNLGKYVNNSFVCTAETLGDREILIRIPSTTKLSWLTHEALSVNITRGNITVDTERVYSCDDGIVLLLSKADAYGVLNISIITTKKPRVNETFEVDFGMTRLQSIRDYFTDVAALRIRGYPVVDPAYKIRYFYDYISAFHLYTCVSVDLEYKAEVDAKLTSFANILRKGTKSALADLVEFKQAIMDHVSTLGAQGPRVAKSMAMVATERSAIVTKEAKIQLDVAERAFSRHLSTLQRLREPVNNQLLRAQIRSKLLWLAIQGKKNEYREYEARAAEALQLHKPVRLVRVD